jgi:hypothetical protein
VEKEGKLSYQVLISESLSFDMIEKIPNEDSEIYSPVYSVLISSKDDAVLVDTPMASEQIEKIIKSIEGGGKKLVQIFPTRKHDDHWFSTALKLRKVMESTAPKFQKIVEPMYFGNELGFRSWIWDRSFLGDENDIESHLGSSKEMSSYREDAQRALAKAQTAFEFYDTMLRLYPTRLNPGALWFLTIK